MATPLFLLLPLLLPLRPPQPSARRRCQPCRATADTRDGDGNVVAGSESDAVQTHDIWTFSRHIGSDDPAWLLIETDSAG